MSFSIWILAPSLMILASCSQDSLQSKMPKVSLFTDCGTSERTEGQLDLPSSPNYQSKNGRRRVCAISTSEVSSIDYEFIVLEDSEPDPFLEELTRDLSGESTQKGINQFSLMIRFDSENYEKIRMLTELATTDVPASVIFVFDGYVVSNVVIFSPIDSRLIEISLDETGYLYMIDRLEKKKTEYKE